MDMEDDWSPIFTARVDKAWKLWLPKAVREFVDLEKADFVEVKIRVVKRARARRGMIQ